MEAAPLTLAHSHARNASNETWKANAVVASTEHQMAAGEFANAARGTEDVEALRTLQLLEEYHRRLATIIKTPSHIPRPPQSDAEKLENNEAAEAPAKPPSDPAPIPAKPPPPKPSARRKPPRDLSSSIASNLATARGIPGSQQRRGTPVTPTVTAQNVSGASQLRSDRGTNLQPPKDIAQRLGQTSDDRASRSSQDKLHASRESPKLPQSSEDALFSRFYSNFGKYAATLSAPLYFAGFPLAAKGSAAASTDVQPDAARPPPKTPPANSEEQEDLASLISKPALRALRETHGPSGPFANPAESFLIVPSTGHSATYATIAGHGANATTLTTLTEEPQPGAGSADGDEFVDASETPMPPSPTSPRKGPPRLSPNPSRRTTPAAGGKTRRGKTIEELELETTTQRQLIDKLSKRLQMWEASSQSQSLALQQMQQSIRARGPPSLSAAVSDPRGLLKHVTDKPEARAPPAAELESANAARVAELEARLEQLRAGEEKARKQGERLARENEKLTAVLARYREKWEELKAGAVARRERERERERGTAPDGGRDGGKIGQAD